MYTRLPSCVERLEFALASDSTVEQRIAASNECGQILMGDFRGTVREDIRRQVCCSHWWYSIFSHLQCHTPDDDPLACHPEFNWFTSFFENSTTKDALGVPQQVNFTPVSLVVNSEFRRTGDE